MLNLVPQADEEVEIVDSARVKGTLLDLYAGGARATEGDRE